MSKKICYMYTFSYKYNCGPCISAHTLPLDGEFNFILKMIYFLENDLKSPLIFVLIFKRVNKIKKKTLSKVTY